MTKFAWNCMTLCSPVNCKMPGFPILHCLLEFAQTHVHWICRPLLYLPSIFPSIRVFSNAWLSASGGQSIGASASVLPMNIQGWFSLGLTGLILLSKGLARVLSRTIVRKHQFFGAIYSFFSDIGFSHMGYYRILSRVPCAIQEVLVNYFIYSSVCMLIPIS